MLSYTHRIRRPCKVCGGMFYPIGRHSRNCLKCSEKRFKESIKHKSKRYKFKYEKRMFEEMVKKFKDRSRYYYHSFDIPIYRILPSKDKDKRIIKMMTKETKPKHKHRNKQQKKAKYKPFCFDENDFIVSDDNITPEDIKQYEDRAGEIEKNEKDFYPEIAN